MRSFVPNFPNPRPALQARAGGPCRSRRARGERSSRLHQRPAAFHPRWVVDSRGAGHGRACGSPLDDHPGWTGVEVQADARGIACLRGEQRPRGPVVLSPDPRALARGNCVRSSRSSSSPPRTIFPRAFEGYRCLFLPGEKHAQPQEQRKADRATGESGTRVI